MRILIFRLFEKVFYKRRTFLDQTLVRNYVILSLVNIGDLLLHRFVHDFCAKVFATELVLTCLIQSFIHHLSGWRNSPFFGNLKLQGDRIWKSSVALQFDNVNTAKSPTTFNEFGQICGSKFAKRANFEIRLPYIDFLFDWFCNYEI